MNIAASQEHQFVNRLKLANERVTAPRLQIFRILRQHSPLSMSSLRQRARANGVDTVTVYRTVALFKRLNLVQEIGVGSYRMLELTDGFGEHHHHLWCTSCGQTLEFDDQSMEQSMTAAADRLGIQIESHQLEIVGICSSCLAKAPQAQSGPISGLST